MKVIEFVRAFVRPYIAYIIISVIVAMAIYLVIKFADADMAKQIITFILATGATITGFYFGERSQRPK